MHALDQGVAICFGRWGDLLLRELGMNKVVDGMSAAFDLRLDDRLVSPVLVKLRAVFDPGFQQLDLVSLERLLGLWRHPIFEVGRRHTLDQTAGGDITRHDAFRAAFEFLQSRFTRGQNEPALAVIGAVAFQAVLGKQRLNVARVVGGTCCGNNEREDE